MIPLSDELTTVRTPWMTYAILAAMLLTWIFVQGAGFNQQALAASVCNLGMVPGELTHMAPLGEAVPLGRGIACVIDNDPINVLTPFISMFLHGGWGHILGNALFFWVFGNNIEDRKGWWRFLLLYLVGGAVATASQVLIDPNSTVPIIGASGAIAAVMGAYLVCYPKARIKSMIFFGPILLRKVTAAWLLILWFVLQFQYVISDAGIAWGAHVGGFTFGALVGLWWRLRERRSTPSAATPVPVPA